MTAADQADAGERPDRRRGAAVEPVRRVDARAVRARRGPRRDRAVALTIALAACGGTSSPTATASAPAAARVGPGLAAALSAAADERAPWRCAALDTPALPDDSLALAGHTWTLGGHALALAPTRPPADTVTIGVLADAGGAAPATLAALGRLRAKLDAAKVDVVLVLGGMGATQGELEATLGALAADAPWPVVALPGDLEPAAAQTAALASLRARHAPVLDGRLVRWIELPGATIGTLPGAGDAARLLAGADGCAYDAADVAAITDALSARPGLRILATAEAPRGTTAGEPTGELALAPHAPIDVVVHGAADAVSPAATGARDGTGAALSPGIADATGRLPGPARPPSAGILAVRGAAWTWRALADVK